MMKWVKALSNSKKAIEDTFNGVGDEWVEAQAEVAIAKACTDKEAWQLRTTMAAEHFDKECCAYSEEW